MDDLTLDEQARLRVGLREIVRYAPTVQDIWWLRLSAQEQAYLIRWMNVRAMQIVAGALDGLAARAEQATGQMAALAAALVAACAPDGKEG